MSTLDEYLAKARTALDELRAQLDEMRVQADLAQADARDRIQAGIASVQKAQAHAKTQLDQAAKSGQDTWQSTAEQAEQTVSDVGAQLQTLVEQLQGSVGVAACRRPVGPGARSSTSGTASAATVSALLDEG